MNAINPYDADYYERGRETGKSGYSGYSWDRLGPYFEATAQHMKAQFSPRRVLDVGCAKGFLVRALVDIGVDALGIDASEYAVSQDTTGRVAVGSATRLPFPAESFDVVTALDVLEHIPESDVRQACAEIVRVSRKWVIARIPTQHEPDDTDPTHVTIRQRDWWAGVFHALGCRVLPLGAFGYANIWWFNVPEYLFVMTVPERG